MAYDHRYKHQRRFSEEAGLIPDMLHRSFGRIINISMNYETMKRKGFTRTDDRRQPPNR